MEIIGTQRLHSSSFLGVPYRILNMNPKKELLWSLWVSSQFSSDLAAHAKSNQQFRLRVCNGREALALFWGP